VCINVGGVFFEVCLVGISAVAAFERGVKALLAPCGAIRVATSMEIGKVFSSRELAVDIICALEDVESKG